MSDEIRDPRLEVAIGEAVEKIKPKMELSDLAKQDLIYANKRTPTLPCTFSAEEATQALRAWGGEMLRGRMEETGSTTTTLTGEAQVKNLAKLFSEGMDGQLLQQVRDAGGSWGEWLPLSKLGESLVAKSPERSLGALLANVKRGSLSEMRDLVGKLNQFRAGQQFETGKGGTVQDLFMSFPITDRVLSLINAELRPFLNLDPKDKRNKAVIQNELPSLVREMNRVGFDFDPSQGFVKVEKK